MSNDGLSGLISTRKTVDRVAFGIFVVTLIFFLALLLSGQSSRKPVDTTTTTTSSLQVVRGPHALDHQTRTVDRVTTDTSPPVWESLLGARQTLFLICAGSLLAAYLLAAIAQRILLGRYAISVGQLSIPDLITREEVADAVTSALSSAEQERTEVQVPERDTEGEQAQEPERIPGPESEPASGRDQTAGPGLAWTYVNDPNLALAGWRIDLEKELRRIAGEFHIPERDQRVLRNIVSTLRDRGVISYHTAKSLQNLLTIANQGVHGANVDAGVINVLRTQGIELLEFLKKIHD